MLLLGTLHGIQVNRRLSYWYVMLQGQVSYIQRRHGLAKRACSFLLDMSIDVIILSWLTWHVYIVPVFKTIERNATLESWGTIDFLTLAVCS
jgi:hypothetical protein